MDVSEMIVNAAIEMTIKQAFPSLLWRVKLFSTLVFISSLLLVISYKLRFKKDWWNKYTEEILFFNFIAACWLFGVFVLGV